MKTAGTVKRKWTLAESLPLELISQFSLETRIPLSLSAVLYRRGIRIKDHAKKFFVPDINYLYDPFIMKGMKIAVERMIQAINSLEKIMIFGDYDVDGTSGVSMFYIFLRKLGLQPLVYIPDRFTDGYGLCNNAIDIAFAENIKLIVAIDCGITAVDKVNYAKQYGINVIICDHHQPPDILPQAFSVLDPLQLDCEYPFKSLCGTGVAFKLIQAVCLSISSDIYLSLLDFVAIATAADMVPLIDENRILVHHGFKHLKENPRASFTALINNSGFNHENINTSNVVFALGPRINAVGRMGDAARAVEFLCCDDVAEAKEHAAFLEKENSRRKEIDSDIYMQAQTLYESSKGLQPEADEDVAIILHNKEWHPGVLGIIASRMVEKYYKPSIILTTFNGTAKGSARSVNNFNIYEALKACSNEFNGLVQFGGHYHAAGLEIELEKVDEFRSSFNRIARKLINNSHNPDDVLVPEIQIDSVLELMEIDDRFVNILKHFEPFGPGNMTPLFMTQDVEIVGEPRLYKDTTSVFRVRKGDSNENGMENFIECIYYQPVSTENNNLKFNRGDKFDIVYSIEQNFWQDKAKTQLRIRDIKPTSIF